MLPKTKSSGFTLIELIIAVVILGVLASLALPSFLLMLRNSEIRAAAESVVNGMQRARIDAVGRNANVQFVLGAGTDTSWTVDYAIKPVPTDPPLDSRSGTEGSKSATRTVLPANATTVTFNNVGQVVANADASPILTQVNVVTAVAGAKSLRVTIGAGGNAKVCDPALPVNSSPSAC